MEGRVYCGDPDGVFGDDIKGCIAGGGDCGIASGGGEPGLEFC